MSSSVDSSHHGDSEDNSKMEQKKEDDQRESLPRKVILTLDHCLLPKDKLEVTPSMRHGLSCEDETDLRLLGCELIQSSGILLRLPQVAMATGQVLLQRFYYSESFVKHNMWYTSMACIALASKIEEAPRRLRDVINVFNHLKQKRLGLPVKAMALDQKYIELKNNVIKAERKLLKELGFCVHVKHPHKFIVTLLQVLGYGKNDSLLQSSWNYMNDCLRTDVFVRHTPETIACSCIYLSARILRVPFPSRPRWFEIFDIKEEDIQDVCGRILAIYARPKPDQLLLEQRIAFLRAKLEGEKEGAKVPEVKRVVVVREINSSRANTPNEDAKSADESKGLLSQENSQDSVPVKETEDSATSVTKTTDIDGIPKIDSPSSSKSGRSRSRSKSHPVLHDHNNHESNYDEKDTRNKYNNHNRSTHEESRGSRYHHSSPSRHRDESSHRHQRHYKYERDDYDSYRNKKREDSNRRKDYDDYDYYESRHHRSSDRHTSSRHRSRSPGHRRRRE